MTITRASAFDRALNFVIAAEGGAAVTEDPNDPGGLTKWGISQRSFPDLSIRSLTFEAAAALYREHYWDRCRCDELPEPVAFALFDAAVNQGPAQAIRLMQRALSVKADGVIGPKTLAAAAAANVMGTITAFVERRWDHYSDLSTARHFLRGWTKRLFRLQAECLWLAAVAER